MADIVLADFNGNTWLVGGIDYLDDLLANTLTDDITIEFVACARKSDVLELWIRHCGEPEGIGDPWLIHPAIVARIRRGPSGHAVRFAPWSAMLDDEANAVIARAVAGAIGAPDATILVTVSIDPAGPPMNAEMARFRLRLIEEKLVEGGVARDRIGHGLPEAPVDAENADRVEILLQTS